MAVKIRLQRHGKKNFAFFHIVVADTRAPRDGRYIEQIGSYNPNTNPATIVLNADRALAWLNVGAEPTLSVRRILSYEGVLLRKHLAGGIAKGALTQEQADAKFADWKKQRDAKIDAKKAGISTDAAKKAKDALAAEAKVNKERAEAIAKRQAEAAAEAAAAEAAAQAEAAAEEAAAEEAPAEAPAEEAAPVEAPVAEEAPAAEAEAPAEA
ncbi:MAG: 30S ribosomal protein S16 [Bacteroidales bacterium]|nr:30S ribosomal protein S16 [Bacteroidales bacterium]